MIYVDSSVVLARVFAESTSPPDVYWQQPLWSSRLLEYETINRVHSRRGGPPQLSTVVDILQQIRLLELSAMILNRALSPFPPGVRTLDGFHLATMDYLRRQGHKPEIATYDLRLLAAAGALGFAAAVV